MDWNFIISKYNLSNNKSKKQTKKMKNKKNISDKTKELNDKLHQSANEIKKEVGNVPVVNLYQFAQMTKSNSKYDLKSQEEWQRSIVYNGTIMEPQDIGNFHFGYIGRAAGLDMNTLMLGAGLYQFKEHWNKSITYANCFTIYTCDDPRDSYYIRLGAIAYDNEN